MAIELPPDDRIYHWVDWDSPGRRDTRAICGQRVDRYRSHASTPTCATCKRILAERRHDEPLEAEDVFGAPPVGTQVHTTFPHPKGATR